MLASIHPIAEKLTEALIIGFRARLHRLWAEAGALGLAVFVTEDATNTYPALPVREGECVMVTFAPVADPATPFPALPRDLAQHLAALPKTLRLLPTARSRLGVRNCGGG